jgi:hypothetical protein
MPSHLRAVCVHACVWVWVVHVVVHSSSSSPFFPAFPCRPWSRFSVYSSSPCFDVRHAYFLPLGAPVPSRNWIDRSALFLSALRLEEEDLFPHCESVSWVRSGISIVLRPRYSTPRNLSYGSLRRRATISLSLSPSLLPLLAPSLLLLPSHLLARQNISAKRKRTNRVVFQHAQRLVHTRPLHRAVVPRHRHRDEAHHDGARLCYYIVSLSLLSLSFHPISLALSRKSNPRHPGSALPRRKGRGGKGKVARGGTWVCTFLRHASGCVAGR